MSGTRPCSSGPRRAASSLFSSPFDETAVDLLEGLDAPAYKIASFEAVDLPLIRYAARLGKPLIISTGMASLDEMQAGVGGALEAGAGGVALLHCVSEPIRPASRTPTSAPCADMAQRFGVVDRPVGPHARLGRLAWRRWPWAPAIDREALHPGPRRRRAGRRVQPGAGRVQGAWCDDCRAAWAALGRVTYDLVGVERGQPAASAARSTW